MGYGQTVCVVEQDEVWFVDRVAQEIGRSSGALKSLRKRDRFPVPDGYLGRRPGWRPSSVQRWLDEQGVPPGAVSGRRAMAKHLGVTEGQLRGRIFPAGDGMHRGNPWWHRDTLTSWARTAFDDELVTEGDFQMRLGCAEDEWDELLSQAPRPFLADPDRWWPDQVNRWITDRGHALRADPDVLFVRDVPSPTGLAADTVRRYRWQGRMPEPDGFHRGRAWWHRATITRWDRSRNRDHAPFPP